MECVNVKPGEVFYTECAGCTFLKPGEKDCGAGRLSRYRELELVDDGGETPRIKNRLCNMCWKTTSDLAKEYSGKELYKAARDSASVRVRAVVLVNRPTGVDSVLNAADFILSQPLKPVRLHVVLNSDVPDQVKVVQQMRTYFKGARCPWNVRKIEKRPDGMFPDVWEALDVELKTEVNDIRPATHAYVVGAEDNMSAYDYVTRIDEYDNMINDWLDNTYYHGEKEHPFGSFFSLSVWKAMDGSNGQPFPSKL